MKLKVWQVIWGLKDGGAENLARVYAQSVDNAQFECTIVTLYPFTNTANYKRALGAGLSAVAIFKRRNIFTRGINLLFGKWYVPSVLKRMLKHTKPDVIHFNSPMAAYFVSVMKELAGIRLLYTCHSEVSKYICSDEESAIRELIKLYGMRLIGLHEDMQEELNARFGVNDVVVIKNGVDIDCFREHMRPNVRKRNSLGIPEDAFVVGHIGRFSRVKNHEFLLKIFIEILKRNQKAYLLLIGNGELDAEVRKRIGKLQLVEHVKILSHRTDIPELLTVMDVMVFPSFYEGLSVTLVEAQASGLRCIVSDSVNQENFLLDTTIPMSLNSDVNAWADAALNAQRRNAFYGNIEDYNMKREIRRLEKVYCGYDPD